MTPSPLVATSAATSRSSRPSIASRNADDLGDMDASDGSDTRVTRLRAWSGITGWRFESSSAHGKPPAQRGVPAPAGTRAAPVSQDGGSARGNTGSPRRHLKLFSQDSRFSLDAVPRVPRLSGPRGADRRSRRPLLRRDARSDGGCPRRTTAPPGAGTAHHTLAVMTLDRARQPGGRGSRPPAR
jgi:hypothetical protein